MNFFNFFILTTLLGKLQQKIGEKANYISRVVYPNGKSANGTLGPMRGAPHEMKVTKYKLDELSLDTN